MNSLLKLTFLSDKKYSSIATDLVELVNQTVCGETVRERWEQELESYARDHPMKISLKFDVSHSTLNHYYFTVKVQQRRGKKSNEAKK